ncbi:MAG TPA: ABC transporter permease, partial [Acidimicrobiia bacterium]|nr:ABC transporter permease [Acidimicrobiia bacterium]
MTDLAPFLIVGITAGSLYGLAGVGLVLTYNTTGIFNFAHGGIAAAAAYLFWELHVRQGWPWPLAALVAVLAVGVVLGAILEPLTRAFISAEPKYGIVATVGLLLVIQGLLVVLFGPTTKEFPPFLPTHTVKLAGVFVSYADIITMSVSALLAGGLYLFFRRSRLGADMRAVVDDSALLSLAGGSPAATRAASWMIGCFLAALSGILIAPSLGLDAFVLTLLVVQAFGACAIGRFSSLPLTYAGGLVVGVATALCTKFVAGSPSLGGLPPSVPFIVLFAVLVLTPAGRMRTAARRSDRISRSTPTAVVSGGRLTTTAAAVSLAGLVAVPFVVGARLPLFTNALIFALVFLSLGLLVTTSGQISLAHAAFVALGATTLSHLTAGAGLPWPAAVLLAGLACVPLGAIVALPAIRLSGIYLALATFGFGILLERVLYGNRLMFGAEGYRSAGRPSLGFLFDTRTDRGLYFVTLAVVVAAAVFVTLLLRSRLGRLLRALGESPPALVTQGLSVNTTRILVFCLSAFLAGVAGALFITAPGRISPVGFGPFESLTWIVILAIAGRRVVPAAFVGAGLLVLAPGYLPDGLLKYQTLTFGALALAALLLGQIDWRARRRPERAMRTP